MRCYSLFSCVHFISTCSLAEPACKALNKQTLGSEEYFHTVKNSGFDKYIFSSSGLTDKDNMNSDSTNKAHNKVKILHFPKGDPELCLGFTEEVKKQKTFKLGYCFLFNTLCQHVLWSGAFWRTKHERNKLSIRTVETKGCLWSSQRPGNWFLKYMDGRN